MFHDRIKLQSPRPQGSGALNLVRFRTTINMSPIPGTDHFLGRLGQRTGQIIANSKVISY